MVQYFYRYIIFVMELISDINWLNNMSIKYPDGRIEKVKKKK